MCEESFVGEKKKKSFLAFSFQLDVLEEVVQAVKGRCDVFLDGGVRQGTDVLKALALGAKAVFIGRPVLWGLACEVAHTHTQTDALYTLRYEDF